MSFEGLKIAELRTIANDFGVDVPSGTNKAGIVALLLDEGVTPQMVDAFTNSEKEEPELDPFAPKRPTLELKSENTVLVKMTRGNYSYQVGGYTFTRENPFAALPESEAQEIFDNHEGFVMATPREVTEFYN